jgi:hypothetical protein
MAFRLATSARNAACNGVVDLIDAGAGAGTIAIRCRVSGFQHARISISKPIRRASQSTPRG